MVTKEILQLLIRLVFEGAGAEEADAQLKQLNLSAAQLRETLASLDAEAGPEELERALREAGAGAQAGAQGMREFSDAQQGMTRQVPGAVGALGELVSAFRALVGALALERIASFVSSLTEAGEEFRLLSASYRALTREAGLSPELAERIREAGHGLISLADAQRAVNRALLAGLPELAQAQTQLARMAVASAAARGDLDATRDIYEQLNEALRRGQARLLAQGDLYLRLGPAVKQLAAEEERGAAIVSSAERSRALLNAVLKDGADSLKLLAEVEGGALAGTEELAVAVGGLRRALAELIATNFSDFFDRLAEGVRGVAGAINALSANTQEAAERQHIAIANAARSYDEYVKQLERLQSIGRGIGEPLNEAGYAVLRLGRSFADAQQAAREYAANLDAGVRAAQDHYRAQQAAARAQAELAAGTEELRRGFVGAQLHAQRLAQAEANLAREAAEAAEAQREVGAASRRAAQEAAEAAARYAQEVAQAQAEAARAEESARRSYHRQLEELEREHHERLSELAEEYSEARARMIEEYERELAQESERRQLAERQRELEHLRRQAEIVEALPRALESGVRAWYGRRRELAAAGDREAIQQLDAAARDNFTLEQKAAMDRILAAEREYDERRQLEREEAELRQRERAAQYERELAEAERQYQRAQQRENENWRRQRERLRRTFQERIADMREDFAHRMSLLEAQHAEEMARVAAHMAALNATIINSRNSLQSTLARNPIRIPVEVAEPAAPATVIAPTPAAPTTPPAGTGRTGGGRRIGGERED